MCWFVENATRFFISKKNFTSTRARMVLAPKILPSATMSMYEFLQWDNINLLFDKLMHTCSSLLHRVIKNINYGLFCCGKIANCTKSRIKTHGQSIKSGAT